MPKWTLDYKPESKKACAYVWSNPPDGVPLKVAAVQRNPNCMTASEFEFNSKLITAAPQLLALLSELCKDRAITRATEAAFTARNEARKLLELIEGGDVV